MNNPAEANRDQVVIRIIDPGESKAWLSFKNYEPLELFYVKKPSDKDVTHLMIKKDGAQVALIPLAAISFMKSHFASSEAFATLYPESPFFAPTRGFLITVHQSQQSMLESLDFLQKYLPQHELIDS